MLLQGKVAIVTGAGRGIGAAIARGFAREGAAVVLASRTAEQVGEQAARIRAEYGGRALPVVCDVADEAQVEALVERTVREFGGVDILANCAGITMVAPSEELTLENWHRCLKI